MTADKIWPPLGIIRYKMNHQQQFDGPYATFSPCSNTTCKSSGKAKRQSCHHDSETGRQRGWQHHRQGLTLLYGPQEEQAKSTNAFLAFHTHRAPENRAGMCSTAPESGEVFTLKYDTQDDLSSTFTPQRNLPAAGEKKKRNAPDSGAMTSTTLNLNRHFQA